MRNAYKISFYKPETKVALSIGVQMVG